MNERLTNINRTFNKISNKTRDVVFTRRFFIVNLTVTGLGLFAINRGVNSCQSASEQRSARTSTLIDPEIHPKTLQRAKDRTEAIKQYEIKQIDTKMKEGVYGQDIANDLKLIEGVQTYRKATEYTDGEFVNILEGLSLSMIGTIVASLCSFNLSHRWKQGRKSNNLQNTAPQSSVS